LAGLAGGRNHEGRQVMRAAVLVGPGEIVLDADDEIAHLDVAANRAAGDAAAQVEAAGDGLTGVDAGLRDLLALAPLPATLDADVAAGPCENDRHRQRRLGGHDREIRSRSCGRKPHECRSNRENLLHRWTRPKPLLDAQYQRPLCGAVTKGQLSA